MRLTSSTGSSPHDCDGAATADVVLLDGALVPRGEATVSAFDRGVMYGESLFETLKVVDGAPCLWDLHRDRLTRGCEESGIPLDSDSVWRGVARLLARRPVSHGVLRVQVTGGVQPGGGRGLVAPTEGRSPRVVASVVESAPMPAATYLAGVDVVTATGFARSVPRLKSGNYLASIRAKEYAESVGAFECIMAAGDPPRLLEGSFSNVLVWDGARLECPAEGDHLPGVILGVVLQIGRELGIPVVMGDVGLAQARGAGILLTGSLLGVCPCATLDGETLEDSVSVATQLRAGLLDREARSREDWRTMWTVSM